MKKALVMMPFSPEEKSRLLAIAENRCQILFYEEGWSREAYHAALAEVDCIIGDPTPADLTCCRNLRWMQTSWAGVDGYVRAGTFPEGAMLCNMTGGYGPVIAEHEVAMILTLCKRLPEYRKPQQAGVWHHPLLDKPLENATVLILGAGDIGTELAKRLRPMVKTIIGVRRTVRACPKEFDRIVSLKELEEVLSLADIIACSLPATEETKGLLSEDRLLQMKRDSVLINVGRGDLIPLEDLCRVLDKGWFWGVGLDVTTPEPLPPEHKLWQYPRVMITPHIAGNTYAPESPTARRIHGIMLDNFERYLQGKPCRNQVDFQTGYRQISSSELVGYQIS